MAFLMLFLATTVGFEYLMVDPIAQRVGMGYAQVGDGYNVHYNPSGLAYTVGSYYSASYMHYIGDTHFGYLGYERNQLGLGIRYFNGGSLKKTDALGQEFGTFGVHFIDINIGKGFVYKDIALGFTIKTVYERIDTLYSLGLGVDVGALYVLQQPEIQVGLAIKNIGSSVKPFIESGESFPYELNVSAAKNIGSGWFGLDVVKPAVMNYGIRIGAGYTVLNNFEIKASYNSLLSSMKTGGSGLDFLTGITLGIAVRKNTICFNYSYTPYFDLGGGHRISVSVGG